MRSKSKYSAETNQKLIEKIGLILSKQKEGVTLPFLLGAMGELNMTTQKLARIISSVNDFLPIVKEKGRDGLMRYKLRSLHAEQGYDTTRFDVSGKVKIEATYWTAEMSGGWVSPRFKYLLEEDNGV